MKRSILILLSIFYVNIVLADVVIINNNKVNDMEVSYRFCHLDVQANRRVCNGIATVSLKADTLHHVVIVPPSDADAVLITSAVEKNAKGQVIAHGTYTFERTEDISNCGYPLTMSGYDGTYKINVAFALQDVRQTPVIMCDSSQY